MKYIYLLVMVAFITSCQPKTETTEESHLGDLKHNFTISEQARASFDEGLLLLHGADRVVEPLQDRHAK